MDLDKVRSWLENQVLTLEVGTEFNKLVAEVEQLNAQIDTIGSESDPMMIELRRLKAENERLAAHQCQYPAGDEFGNAYCTEINKLRGELASVDEDEVERLKAELHSVRVHKNKGLLYKKDENDRLREALELALETEGSKVIATQDKVEYCPVTSMCVPKHHSECWIGQAKEVLKEAPND